MKITLKVGVLAVLILFFLAFIINDKWGTEGFDMDPMSYSSSSPMGVSPPSCAGITPSWPLNSLGTVTTINPPSATSPTTSPTPTSSPTPTKSAAPTTASTTMSPSPTSSPSPS